ncbi:MAG: hypothetical protein RJA56_1888 [Pseudomonadota bacterium]
MVDSSAPYLRLALALSLGAAVSLGITRFAYGLLLPPMRDDLLWSYTLAGGMNTANAVGYLIGALVTPSLLRRWSPSILLMWGAVGASLFMALSGFFVAVWPLMAQRLLAGVASAVVFIAGGLLAARLGARQTQRSGLLFGPVLRWHGHWHCAVCLAGAGGVAMGASAAARMVLGVVVFSLGVRLGHVGSGLACKGFGTLGVCQPRTRGIGYSRAHVSATAHGLCFGGLHRLWRGLHRLHDVRHRTLA